MPSGASTFLERGSKTSVFNGSMPISDRYLFFVRDRLTSLFRRDKVKGAGLYQFFCFSQIR